MAHHEQPPYPKGSFPVRISVTGNGSGSNASDLLASFMDEAQENYQLSIVSPLLGDASHAEAVIAVPFPDREHIRIAFNIFASEAEDQYGTGLYFHMESAF